MTFVCETARTSVSIPSILSSDAEKKCQTDTCIEQVYTDKFLKQVTLATAKLLKMSL